MGIVNISSANKIIDKCLYGGKAYWLSWLTEQGYRVPPCFFISAIDETELKKTILNHLCPEKNNFSNS